MKKPYQVKVQWTRDIEVADLPQYECRKRDHLYVIIRKRSILGIPARKVFYIGMAYKQSVVSRLSDHHKLPKIVSQRLKRGKVVIRVGEIRLPIGKRMSLQVVRDVESALIYDHQPEFNQMSIASYRGRTILVRNKGKRKPLPRIVDSRLF